MGGDVQVFEIQENSDVTFRLYDWNHIDAKTGKPMPPQADLVIPELVRNVIIKSEK